MAELTDHELLAEFAKNESEEAFAALVARYVNLVYSTALRFTANAHSAEEITQAVFIILAKKAGSLPKGTILPGWLYQTARLTAANYLRNEIRRAHREHEAYMQSRANETDAWPEIAPLLEDAMGRLNEKERNAIVLRFFEGKSFQEIGAAFGGSENAAKKRVIRGLEKLRSYFARRGVTSTTVIIAEKISTHSIQAAPVALVKTVAAVAVAKGAAASTSTLTLIKGALKLMAWTKAKTAIIAASCILLGAGTTAIAVKAISHHSGLIAGKTESEWIKSIVYFGDDNQRKTWHSLGSQGIGMLMRALSSPTNDHPTRMCVVSVLDQLSSFDDHEYFPQLIGVIKTEKDDSVLALEITCFDQTFDKMPGRDKSELFPELVRALDNSDSGARNNALVILQYYSDRANTVIPLIVEKLQDPVPGVRVMAAKALNKIDPQNSARSDLVTVLAQCVTDPPRDMPGAPDDAVLMLGQLHQKPEVAVPALILALQSGDSYVRANSAWALGKFGIEAKPAVGTLTKALQDSDALVRRQAAGALRRINSGAAPG